MSLIIWNAEVADDFPSLSLSHFLLSFIACPVLAFSFKITFSINLSLVHWTWLHFLCRRFSNLLLSNLSDIFLKQKPWVSLFIASNNNTLNYPCFSLRCRNKVRWTSLWKKVKTLMQKGIVMAMIRCDGVYYVSTHSKPVLSSSRRRRIVAA